MLQTLVTNTPVRPLAKLPAGELPSSARTVIIGGGIVGASVAYHLAKLGWKNLVLLEQGEIGGGTTWHAAGMVGQLRASNSLTKINKYSVELYRTLEQETGHDIGWLPVGSLIVGTSEARMTQLRRTAAMAEVFGVEAQLIGPGECQEKWPLIRIDDVLGGVWLPHDGRCIPGATAVALAKGAAMHGACIVQHTQVQEIKMRENRVVGLRTDKGDISCELAILCGGMWSRQLGLSVGVDIPLYPVEHHYVLSEPIAGVTRDFPCGRDPNGLIYFRTLDDGSIMLGAFQLRSQPWMVERVPDDFAFKLLDEDWGRYVEPLAAGKHRIPALEQAQFPKFVNGPESFTPDNNFIMGEPPGVQGMFVLAGFNSVGIACAGGAGKYAAEWLQAGGATMDLWSVDIRRFMPFQNDRSYLRERSSEILGLHYQMAWPNREMETARGVKRTALYETLKERGACFGTVAGWERANWFAPSGVEPRMEYSFEKPNWTQYVAEETRACRERAAIFDQSTFSKYIIQGKDALAILQWLCANNLDVSVGKVVYTAMLNSRGTFESDFTGVRLAEDQFYIITGSTQTVRDRDWISRIIPVGADVHIEDLTAALGVISVMGPRARDILSRVTSTELDNAAFPFGTAKQIEIEGVSLRAIRITYVGELGWELHVPYGQMNEVHNALLEVGGEFGLKHAGNFAINTMRIEKAYRAWGHDISQDETPLEAGLGFALHWNKEFLGKSALVKQKKQGPRKRLLSFILRDPGARLWGSEPIRRDGKIVGYTTSATYSPTFACAVGMGYVRNADGSPLSKEDALNANYTIVSDGKAYKAEPHWQSPYDPERKKILC